MSSEKQPQSERPRAASARKPDQTATCKTAGAVKPEFRLARYSLPSISTQPQLEAVLSEKPAIFVIDDDYHVRKRICRFLAEGGLIAEDYATSDAFFASRYLHRLNDTRGWLPAIVITSKSDESLSVQVIVAGALDFIAKPAEEGELLAIVRRTLERAMGPNKSLARPENSTKHAVKLTPRQIQIMEMVLAGHPSKNIAADLGISQRTVENHRASIMKRTGVKSLPALTRLALAGALRASENSTHDD
jgi:two-component system CheB/CheR fusion protein